MRSQPGEAHGRAVLTRQEVIEMRVLHRDFGLTYASVADWYGIAPATAKSICRGRRWRSVPLDAPLEAPARRAQV